MKWFLVLGSWFLVQSLICWGVGMGGGEVKL